MSGWHFLYVLPVLEPQRVTPCQTSIWRSVWRMIRRGPWVRVMRWWDDEREAVIWLGWGSDESVRGRGRLCAWPWRPLPDSRPSLLLVTAVGLTRQLSPLSSARTRSCQLSQLQPLSWVAAMAALASLCQPQPGCLARSRSWIAQWPVITSEPPTRGLSSEHWVSSLTHSRADNRQWLYWLSSCRYQEHWSHMPPVRHQGPARATARWCGQWSGLCSALTGSVIPWVHFPLEKRVSHGSNSRSLRGDTVHSPCEQLNSISSKLARQNPHSLICRSVLCFTQNEREELEFVFQIPETL